MNPQMMNSQGLSSQMIPDANLINSIGGIQDTMGQMKSSLDQYELNPIYKNSIDSQMSQQMNQ
jgi:hypothetical protein